MQNKSEIMIGKFQHKYQFWDGFGKGFGRVWEDLEGIKIRWKKDVKIRGRGAQVLIAALGHSLYKGGLGRLLEGFWAPGPPRSFIFEGFAVYRGRVLRWFLLLLGLCYLMLFLMQ